MLKPFEHLCRSLNVWTAPILDRRARVWKSRHSTSGCYYHIYDNAMESKLWTVSIPMNVCIQVCIFFPAFELKTFMQFYGDICTSAMFFQETEMTAPECTELDHGVWLDVRLTKLPCQLVTQINIVCYCFPCNAIGSFWVRFFANIELTAKICQSKRLCSMCVLYNS
jgi:hypothetical protein